MTPPALVPRLPSHPSICRSFVENLIDWNRVEQRYLAATKK